MTKSLILFSYNTIGRNHGCLDIVLLVIGYYLGQLDQLEPSIRGSRIRSIKTILCHLRFRRAKSYELGFYACYITNIPTHKSPTYLFPNPK